MRCGVNCEAALQPPRHGQSLPSAASADFYAAVFFPSIPCFYRFSSTWLKAIDFHELNGILSWKLPLFHVWEVWTPPPALGEMQLTCSFRPFGAQRHARTPKMQRA